MDCWQTRETRSNPAINTGTKYSTTTFLFRQQYDLGQKDSIVTDTSVIPLFYPRLRMEHTFTYTTSTYQFMDDSTANTPTRVMV